MQSPALLDELRWRNLLFQHTAQFGGALQDQLTAYVGFDPTAPSLHIGNLVPVMGLVHLQRAGHRPIALVGGGTGLIGDPGGKSQERPLADQAVVASNADAIRRQLERFLDFTGPAAARMAESEPVDGERGVVVNTASVAAFEGQVGHDGVPADWSTALGPRPAGLVPLGGRPGRRGARRRLRPVPRPASEGKETARSRTDSTGAVGGNAVTLGPPDEQFPRSARWGRERRAGRPQSAPSRR